MVLFEEKLTCCEWRNCVIPLSWNIAWVIGSKQLPSNCLDLDNNDDVRICPFVMLCWPTNIICPSSTSPKSLDNLHSCYSRTNRALFWRWSRARQSSTLNGRHWDCASSQSHDVWSQRFNFSAASSFDNVWWRLLKVNHTTPHMHSQNFD